MNKIEDAIQNVHKLDHSPSNNIHPLIKLLITFIYLILLTSINKYDLTTTLAMFVFLVLLSIIQEIKIKDIVKRFKIIFILLIFVGISNPILDRNIISYCGNIPITTGLISMITLILKSFFAVICTYFLIYTTSIDEICYSLTLLHFPTILITTIMLIYRYIILFLKEAQRIWISYQMRAPKQKGLNYKVWGSMIGSLMIRSIDKARIVYESMELRGFNPETSFCNGSKLKYKDFIIFILAVLLILILRYIPIFEYIGNIVM